jgi:hypothetical protein
MIGDIGLMIGIYIIIRLVSLLTRTGERKESGAVKIFAVVAMLVTVFCIVDLFEKSAAVDKAVAELEQVTGKNR